MHPLDLAIIVLYLIFMSLVGWWVSKKASQSAESYFLAGQSLPWWITADGQAGSVPPVPAQAVAAADL